MPDTDIISTDPLGPTRGRHQDPHRRTTIASVSRSSSRRRRRTRPPSPPPVPPKSPYANSSAQFPSANSTATTSRSNSTRNPHSRSNPNINTHSKRPASDPHPAPATPQRIFSDDDSGYVECPLEGCGEVVGLSDMDLHLDLHSQEDSGNDAAIAEVLTDSGATAGDRSSSSSMTATPEETMSPRSARRHHRRRSGMSSRPDTTEKERDRYSNSKQQSTMSILLGEKHRKTIQEWKMILTGSPPSLLGSKAKRRPHTGAASSSMKAKRLGKSELGKYAHELRMPEWLVSLLKKGGQVENSGMIPVIEQLLEQSQYLSTAYLCHLRVKHISKLRREGGFCGYRNIQMLISYIISARSQGREHFKNGIPSVFELQEQIENAWDKGINSYGRVETGGVRGTRKFIGTPERLHELHEIPKDFASRKFKYADVFGGFKAMASLLDEVETYFQSGVTDPAAKVHCTDLPPIYFQHRGHSMTIIGLEKQRVGQHAFTNLLVFDPMFSDSSSLTKLAGLEFRHKEPDKALNAYRRRLQYLQRYREFEVLKLVSPSLR
ncbi:peptidase family C78 [Zalerion maritima]|uniref:Peptidase family C78 n=1 Tax=Zalerion maritima TaxID=339359 RepID=A0AAD5WSB6_9PEZI|nr:peptidase family C78 [Zalerion maritima]